MTKLYWKGNKIFQSIEGDDTELAHVRRDQSIGKYILWIADVYEFTGVDNLWFAGDRYWSLAQAKEEALNSHALRIFHTMSIIFQRKKRNRENLLEGDENSVPIKLDEYSKSKSQGTS